MSAVLRVALPLVLLANGLAGGVLVWGQLGGWPLLRAQQGGDYVRMHAFFAARYDPFMPVCIIVTVLGDGLLAVAARQPLFGVAALLAVAGIVISLTKNVPVNRWIRTIDPDHLPADFAAHDPRRAWGAWNQARSALLIAAFVLNCLALGLVL